MTIEEADDSNANPRYKEGKNYQINCQRCVPAYELRRRGFNVEALSAADDSIWENENSMVVFYGSRGMRFPKTFIDPESKEYVMPTLIGKRTMKQAYKKLEEIVKNDERYFLAMAWAKGGAHIVNMEKIDGVLSIVDSQSGKILPIDKYFSYYKAKPSSLNYCRIDNLDINPDLINKLVKAKDGGEQK
nr:toxin glutamine deamidase domain-containing protein [Enterococcus asini]